MTLTRKEIWSGGGFGEYVNICDDCLATIEEPVGIFETEADSSDRLTCNFCLKNPVEATCVNCNAVSAYYQKFQVPNFEGKLGLSRENWNIFLGFIGVALCKDCVAQGWNVGDYAAGNQVVLRKECIHECACIKNGVRKTGHFPQISPEHLLPVPK